MGAWRPRRNWPSGRLTPARRQGLPPRPPSSTTARPPTRTRASGTAARRKANGDLRDRSPGENHRPVEHGAPVTMILGHYCEITAPVAQDHGVLGRPQPHAPDFHGRRSISDAWRPLLTVIMDGPAVRRA